MDLISVSSSIPTAGLVSIDLPSAFQILFACLGGGSLFIASAFFFRKPRSEQNAWSASHSSPSPDPTLFEASLSQESLKTVSTPFWGNFSGSYHVMVLSTISARPIHTSLCLCVSKWPATWTQMEPAELPKSVLSRPAKTTGDARTSPLLE
jgi:hypothetical protein